MITGAAAFVSYYLSRLPPGATLPTEQTAAMITLFAASLYVLVLIARPFAWWKAVLVATMVGLFVLVSVFPAGRRFFQLQYGGWEQVLTSLAVACCAAVALELLWRWARHRDAETLSLTRTG